MLERLLIEQAAWLRIPKTVNGNGLPLFKKTFFAKKSDSCKISATALGLFELYLNGKRVGLRDENGELIYDELKPGNIQFTKRAVYYTYDLSEYLVDGKNILLAVVAGGWFKWYKSSDIHDFKFRAAMEQNGIYYITNETWTCSVGGPVINESIHNGETYDANEPSFQVISSVENCGLDWTAPDIDTSLNSGLTQNLSECLSQKGDGSTASKSLVFSPVITTSGRVRRDLVMRPVKTWAYSSVNNNGTDFGYAETHPVLFPYHVRSGETVVVDMGQNMVGTPLITLHAKKDTKIRFGCGEVLNDSGKLSRRNDGPKDTVYHANYRKARSEGIFISGENEIERYRANFTYFGFRYLDITASDEFDILDLTGEVICGLENETGIITTSSNDINGLFRNILWGQRGNYLGVATDCPQRDERMGWTGDAQVFCRTGSYNADTYAFMRKYMQDMRDSQGEEGQVPNTWPNPRPKYGSAAWADAAVIIPYTMYLMYGNRIILEENYESLERFMSWLATRDNMGANAEFGDWVATVPTDAVLIGNAYYVQDARMMAYISSQLSKEDGDYYSVRARHYLDVMDGAKKAFAERYYDTDGYFKDNANYRSQTAHLIALHFDLVPENMRPRFISELKKKIEENNYRLSTGFVGTSFILPTLSEIGLDDIAYALLTQPAFPSWVKTVREGGTTMWEHWNSYTTEDGIADPAMNSFNHYAHGSVGEWMYRFMAGIEADEAHPGFGHFILQPRVDTRSDEIISLSGERITSVDCEFKTAHGVIRSAWSYTDGKFTYRVTIPEGTTATLHLPEFEGKTPKTDSGILLNKNTCELTGGEYEFIIE